jgi:hypothetical protein
MEYIKLKLGDMIKFGQSTRWLILNGPDEVREQMEEEEQEKQLLSAKDGEVPKI